MIILTNIYDYVMKKQEEIKEINTIDAMILTRITYFHWENILDKVPCELENLNSLFTRIKMNSKDEKLLSLIVNSLRFKKIKVIRVKHVLDEEKEEQFLALTYLLPNKSLFIAFRGTNKSLIGFKEDLNMCYETIPSQKEALDYFNSTKGRKKIYLGGHSKGGNLAMYAAINASPLKRRLIKKVYNFDGPGFLSLDSKFYKMRHKIINYFPENSIVGRLMMNDNIINPVVTSKEGIDAHNMYYWNISLDELEKGNLSLLSNEFHQECLHLLEVINIEKRKHLVNNIFTMILKKKIKSFQEMKLQDIKGYLDEIPKLQKEEKEELLKFIKLLMKIMLPYKKKSI